MIYKNLGKISQFAFSSLFVFSYCLIRETNSVLAQIVPDSSSPGKTNTYLESGAFNYIKGGVQQQDNLFHSFQEFNLPSSTNVYFEPPREVKNIFSRVTGGKASKIDGTFGVVGYANLFFINPNGIRFGSGATLDLLGSLVLSTADSIIFSNGERFSATNPSDPASLNVKMNVPVGLQFFGRSKPIEIQGSKLEIKPAQNIVLVGGDVRIDNANLKSNLGSRVEITGVTEAATVDISSEVTPRLASPENMNNLGEVSLLSSKIYSQILFDREGGIANSQVPGDNVSGGIGLYAKNINISNSQISADGAFFAPLVKALPLTMFLSAKERINLDTTKISNNSGGGVIITSKIFNMNNSQITSSVDDAFPQYETSNYEVITGDVDIQSFEKIKIQNSRLILSMKSYDVAIDDTGTKSSNLTPIISENPTEQSASSSLNQVGLGNSENGEIVIEGPQEIPFAISPPVVFPDIGSLLPPGFGTSFLLSPNYYFPKRTSSNINSGRNANLADLRNSVSKIGSINLLSQSIEVSGQSIIKIDSSTSFNRLSEIGDINFDATQLTRISKSEVSSIIGSSNRVEVGDIRINTGYLELTDKAKLSTEIQGKVTAPSVGNIELNARTAISLSDATVATTSESSNSAGDISLKTVDLKLDRNTIVEANSSGSGVAGNIDVTSDGIFIGGRSKVNATANSSSGGNIDIRASNLLLMRQGAEISTNARGQGTGGNITINAKNGFLVAVPFENSDIKANAFNGKGGEVTIDTRKSFGISPRSRVDLIRLLGTDDPQQLDPIDLSSNDITAISQNNPSLNGTVALAELNVDPTRGLDAPPVDPDSPNVSDDCTFQNQSTGSRVITSGRGGITPTPADTLTASNIWQDPASNKNISAISPPETILPIAQGWVSKDAQTVILVGQTTPKTKSIACHAR